MTVCWDLEFASLYQRFGSQPFVFDGRTNATYADVFRRAAGVSHALERAGVVSGVPVATLLPNGLDAVCASLGVTLSGAIEIPLNVQQADAERRRCLALVGARHMLTDAEAAPNVNTLELNVHRIETIGQDDMAPGRWRRPADETWGRILFTSGTTGQAKGAVHTHRGRWLANLMLRAHLPFVPSPGDNLLLMTPFSHGASLLTYAWMGSGGGITLLQGVDPVIVLPLVREGRVNSIFAPPTVLAKLVAALQDERVAGVRAIFTGTATLSRELYRAAKGIFGPVIRVTYGMSEIFNPITVLEADQVDAAYGDRADDNVLGACLGWPAAGVEVDIRDEDGQSVAAGTAGEIHVRAPHAFAGYVTSSGFQARDVEAFHATGDIGSLDARGRLYLAGRMNDVIKTGGYKVVPQEVEESIAPVLGNSTLVVLGLPSAYWGEVIVGVAENAPADWRERAAAHMHRLSAHKRPRILVEIPELPRNAIGKVNRKATAEKILAEYELIDGRHPRLEPRCKPHTGN